MGTNRWNEKWAARWVRRRRRLGGVDMGDDPGVTGDQNGIGKFHWSRSPAQVDSVRMGRFRELLFWYVPGKCGIGRPAVKRAEVLKHWKNRLNHPLLQVLTNRAGSL